MSQKFGWALAAFFAFKLLAFVGFEANVAPTGATKDSLVLLMSLIPAVLGVFSIIIFFFYPLNDRRMLEINQELQARRASTPNP